jgi:hypothetical protein
MNNDIDPRIERAQRETEITPMREERRVENLLQPGEMDRRRRSADVIADFLDLDPKTVEAYIEAMHSPKPEIVEGARSALRIAYPDAHGREAMVEYIKAKALDDLGERLARQVTRCDSVLRGDPNTECRHLVNQENRILKWIVITFVAAVVLMGLLGFIAWTLRQMPVVARAQANSFQEGSKP